VEETPALLLIVRNEETRSNSCQLRRRTDTLIRCCSVTVGFSADSAGTPHAEGTFSGTVASDAIDGGTYAITDGVFDLMVTLPGG
jgi:hypothetical protein